MAKVVLPSVASGYNVSTINSNFQAIATELNNKVLYRANPVGEPNQLTTDVDMNSKRLLNLPAPTTDLEPLRRIDAADIAAQSAAAVAAAAQAVVAKDAAVAAQTASGVSAANSASSAVTANSARVAAEAAEAAAEQFAEDAYDNSRLTVGTVVTAPPGGDATVIINGVPGAQVIDFTIPRGSQGIQGIQGPPGPTGSGTGDVLGPVSSVVDHIVLFGSTDGKQIKTSGIPLSAKQDALGFTPENIANKGIANGYAPLDGDAKVPLANLPTITAAEVITPSNVSPANAATDVFDGPTFTGSTFYSNYSATHANTQVQVHTTNVFTSPLYSSGDQAPSTSFTMPTGILSTGTQYFWRIRYKNSRGTYSDWSTSTSFTTAAAFNNYIATPAATPAVGASFEGGFYAGMIWNEVTQSSTSKLLATGTGVTFTVPNMATTPIVYSGQTLEIRSRANPTNKFICTVTAAVGTTLTVNVSSIGGSGTFSDWSIMSQYRIIVAPKATGETGSQVQFKNVTTANPALAYTPSEGRKATTLIVADGNSTVYPAAHFANSLSIAGRTDWYCPSRDEMMVVYRGLKPTSDSNVTSGDAPINSNYNTYGAFGDASPGQGINLNSSPTYTAYTTGVPAQTSVTAFQSGGTEALVTSASGQYWTISEGSLGGTNMMTLLTSTSAGGAGKTLLHSKSNSAYVRAVRRSII